MSKEYYRVNESQKGQFAGVRMNYHVWQRGFIATVHSQQMPPAESVHMSAIRWITRWWSLESVKTFITVEDQDVMRTGNKGAVHQVELIDNCFFRVHKDTTLAVTCHMLTCGRRSGRKVRKSEDCNRKEKPSRLRLALRSICNSCPVMSNKSAATEQRDDVQVANKLERPSHEQCTLCVRRRR
jgi:hypothetical protein